MSLADNTVMSRVKDRLNEIRQVKTKYLTTNQTKTVSQFQFVEESPNGDAYVDIQEVRNIICRYTFRSNRINYC